MTNTQTFWSAILHAIAQGVVWFGPLLILQIPASIGTLTVSGILSIGVAWVAHQYVTIATVRAHY